MKKSNYCGDGKKYVRRLPNQFWAEAVSIFVYLLNLSPTKVVMNRTPYEVWHGRKPSVSHLRIFGCVAYA